MTVKASDIEVGKCFVTISKQVRRVTEITDGKVDYEARGRSYKRGKESWSPSGVRRDQLPDKANFASQVERIVTCDWDPDYPERDSS